MSTTRRHELTAPERAKRLAALGVPETEIAKLSPPPRTGKLVATPAARFAAKVNPVISGYAPPPATDTKPDATRAVLTVALPAPTPPSPAVDRALRDNAADCRCELCASQDSAV